MQAASANGGPSSNAGELKVVRTVDDDDIDYVEVIEADDVVTVIVALVRDGEVTSYIVRNLSPSAYQTLKRDLDAAAEAGESIESVAAAWALMHEGS